MSNHKILFLAIALLMGSGLLWILFQSGSSTRSIEAWGEADIELIAAEIEPEAFDFDADAEPNFDRQELPLGEDAAAIAPSERRRLGIFGRIVDSSGRPLSAATVRLEVSDANRGIGGRFRRGQRERVRKPFITGRDGQFSFKLRVYAQTQVNIYASRDGLAPTIAEHIFEADTDDLDTGDTVLTSGGSLIGRITDVAGTGIADADASLRPGNGNALAFAPNREQMLAPSKSDAAGFFAFPHLMPGEYRITAEARHHRRRQEQQTILIEEGQQLDLGSIVLGPGFEIFGYVYDKLGAPLQGARIEVTNSPAKAGEPRAGGGRDSRANERSRSGSDGSFSIDHLPAAPMSLLVRAAEHLSFRQDDIDPALGQAISVQLRAGLSISGRVLDESSGLAVTSYAAKLRRLSDLPQTTSPSSERFRGRRGNRGQGGRGQDFRQGFNRWRSPNRIPDDLDAASAHPDGTFRFAGLDEGIYIVDVGGSPEHHMMRSDRIELRRENGGASVELRLSKGHTISGQVVAKANGAPLLGIRVDLMKVREDNQGRDTRQRGRRGGGNRGGRDMSRFISAMQTNAPRGERIISVDSDAAGMFHFSLQAPAEYFLVASGKGYAKSQGEPFALTEDHAKIELQLGHQASLSGQIAGIRSDHHAAVHVLAFAGIRDQKSVLANADGSYRFDDLEPGDYYVRAVLGDPQTYRRQMIGDLFTQDTPPRFDLSLVEGQEAKLNLLLEVAKIGEVRGTIRVNGQPAAGYGINLVASNAQNGRGRRGFGGGRGLTATSDSRGEFRLHDIPVADYSLRVQPVGQRRGGDIHQQDIVVQIGLSTDVHIELFVGSIKGTVTAVDGSPMEDLRGQIFILPGQTELPDNLREFAGRHPFSRISVSEGKFAADELRIGPALLVLRINGRKEVGSLIQILAGRETEVAVKAGAKVASK